MRVFDAGDSVADRYTVFPWPDAGDRNVRRMYLGVDGCGGRSFSQWGEGDVETMAEIDVEIAFADMPEETQKHVLAMLAD